MNYNHMPHPHHRRRTLLMLVLTVAIVLVIVYLKQSASREKTLRTANGLPATAATRPVAVPDTTVAPDILPAAPDTAAPSVLPDTLLGKDRRDPYEAGYEDGYGSGSDDGAARQPRASYDETSSFRSAREKQKYAEGYAEGYAKGYEDGEQKRQFNIHGVQKQP